MSGFVFVTAANDPFFRNMVANLIISSRDFGRYRWHVVMDEPLGIGEQFTRMPAKDIESWRTNESAKFWMKFDYMKLALESGTDEYAIWLDADAQFFGPPQVERLLALRFKTFCLLESDILKDGINWFYKPDDFKAWLARLDYQGDSYFNINGGFMGIRRDAFGESMTRFHRAVDATLAMGWKPETDELYFSYVVQSMTRNPDALRMIRNLDVFMCTCDYPRPKGFWEYGTDRTHVLPAQVRLGIVHHMGCDEALAKSGRERLKSFR
jgi:hypothetical protein